MTSNHQQPELNLVSSPDDIAEHKIKQAAIEIGDGNYYHDQAIWDIGQLEALEATTPNTYVSEHVRRLLGEVSRQADMAISRVHNPTIEGRKGGKLDQVLTWFARRPMTSFGHWWGEVAVGITAVICTLVVLGNLAAALVLLLIRLAGTFFVGRGPYALIPPLQTGQGGSIEISRVNGASRAILSSTLSHLADIAMLAAMAIYLQSVGQATSAAVLLASISVVATGSFMRIAPSQLGQLVSQSPWERVFRLGGFCIALAASLPTTSVFDLHPLTFAALSAGSYGTWDIARSIRFLTTRSNQISSVRIRATRSDGSPMEVFVAPTSRAAAGQMRVSQTG